MDSSHGIIVKLGGNVIAKLINVAPPKSKLSIHESTNHNSGGVEESIGGILRYDSVNITFGFDPTDTSGQIALSTAQANKAVEPFTIDFPNGASWSFNALVEEWQPIDGGDVDGLLTGNALLKITGKPTFSTTASTGLTSLTASTGTLTPDFATGTYTYVLNVTALTDSITLTPTAAGSTITVNGVNVASGSASQSITLGVAGSVTPVKVTVQQSGKTPKVYEIYVARAEV